MTYLISDICGHARELDLMLQHISFSDGDILYVLGNQVGKGPDSIGVLNDLSMRSNVYPIAGKNDFRALRMLSGFDRMAKDGSAPDADFISEMTAWASEDGGREILDAFRELDEDGKEGILDYLSDMTLFEQAEVNGKSYFLVSSNVKGSGSAEDVEDYPPEAFTEGTPDVTAPSPVAGFVTVVGSTPTGEFPGGENGRIFRNGDWIALNCDIENGGKLACLCLETGKEFYVG